jgi:alkyl hydroperoxide reductase subunit D
MSLDTIKNAFPEYAKDIKLNLSTVLTEMGAPGLDMKQIAAIAIASASASRYKPLTAAIMELAETHLSPTEISGAKMAMSLMSMTNIYYRFTHLVKNKEYATMQARLRMNGMANPGLDKISFELASIAVSSINGCGMCLDSHEKTLIEHGVSAQMIQSAIRIAATIFASAVTLSDAE